MTLKPMTTDQYVAKLLEGLPPLTDEQIEKAARILATVDQEQE